MKRRTFGLGTSAIAAGIALDAACPGSWMQAVARELSEGAEHPKNDRILVVVQLSGGNDGLNTVIPFRNELYLKARPKLGIDASSLVSIQSELGFHPSLRALADSFESGRMCVVQGVGYDAPNRSHFESMDIWHTCYSKKDRKGSGWLGRYLSTEKPSSPSDAIGLHVGGEPQPLALVDRNVQVPSIASIEQMRLKERASSESKPQGMEAMDAETNELLGFVSTSTQAALAASERLEKALAAPDQSGEFPSTGLGERLKTVSRLILSGLTTRIYYVTLDGFDTHANQAEAHAGLLRQWSDAVSSFCQSMQRAGQQDRVLVMTFSEFGRRVAENASLGTDHGAAAPMFLNGPAFANAFVGEHPDLGDLIDGDLKYSIDFRDVYATVIEDWLGGSSAPALGPSYQRRNTPSPLFRMS